MIELSKGQDVALASSDGQPLTRLRVGLGWDKVPTAGFIGSGAPDVDLDASVFQFSGEQLFDLAFYNNKQTRDGSVVHEGDNLSGRGDGDDEVVLVDLSKVYAKVDTIVLLISSYHGHSLEFVHNIYVRITDEVDPDTEVARFKLGLEVPESGVVMATLVRDPESASAPWRLRTIGAGIPVTIPTDAIAQLRPFL